MGSDIGLSGYGVFVFVGAYYIHQKNHTNLSADFKVGPAVVLEKGDPKYQSLELDDSVLDDGSFAFDIGIGYRVFRHIYVDIRYRHKFISTDKNYLQSKGITSGDLSSKSNNLILGINYNF